MDAIREQTKKPLVVGALGLILGIILGVFYAWVISPVEYIDADIPNLRQDLQVDYLRMAIDSYAYNHDVALATTRYERLGDGAEAAMAGVVAEPLTVKPEDITAFSVAVGAGSPLVPGVTAEPGTEQPTPSGGGGLTRVLFPILCVVALVVIAGAVFLFIYRGRTQPSGAPAPVKPAPPRAVPQAEWQEYPSAGPEPPMVQFMASYKLGDDLFDDSFSIDSPAGEFLGECGVSISETIGVGESKRVSAFEVWLFDKNDIQTVTKVLMSAHAFLDESTRQRLAAKGEPVLAEPGTESMLETQTLRLVARVVDMGYGDGALPEQSYFERLILELAVWSKA
jgi:hypothetical protein